LLKVDVVEGRRGELGMGAEEGLYALRSASAKANLRAVFHLFDWGILSVNSLQKSYPHHQVLPVYIFPSQHRTHRLCSTATGSSDRGCLLAFESLTESK
jgi:hypothetical protein